MTASNKIRIIKMNNRTIEKFEVTRKTFYIEADEKWNKKQYDKGFNG